MSEFLKDSLNKLDAYTPGEQPQNRKYIKLNTNESPYPPSKSVIDAITKTELQNLRLYSDPECKALKEKLAEIYNVKMQNIFVSNGSDDILNFAFMAYGSDGVVFPKITYGFYSVFSALYSLDAEIIPLNLDFTINTEDYKNKNKLIVIANPNAPTGIEMAQSSIEEIVKTNKNNVVLIDEAYVDFGGTSALELTKKYKNLLIVRTFSKSRSMAGARLGFAIGDKELIQDLEKIKYSTNPYNINRLTQLAGVKALEEDEYYINNCKEICATREYTVEELKKLGFEVLPSKANFLFAKSSKIDGLELYTKLKENGILVRHFNTAEISQFNRITIGTKSEMQELIKTIKFILGEN